VLAKVSVLSANVPRQTRLLKTSFLACPPVAGAQGTCRWALILSFKLKEKKSFKLFFFKLKT
jgi:hypothetical protein